MCCFLFDLLFLVVVVVAVVFVIYTRAIQSVPIFEPNSVITTTNKDVRQHQTYIPTITLLLFSCAVENITGLLPSFLPFF